jgi:hypothetical protein
MRITEIITEATRKYEHKAVDPALMTFQEYRTLVDPKHTMHPHGAYESNVEKLNRYATKPTDEYSILVNTITRHNLSFEVRMHKEDRREFDYVKTDSDSNIVYGEGHKVLYFSPEEKEAMFPEDKRWKYEFAIIDKESGMIVGNTQDEWGTLLVMVASEYRKFGFGTLLVKLVREKNPTRQSGGFTYGGKDNFARVHAGMVREYMESGFYSFLVKSGQISLSRAKAIIASIPERKKHKEKDLDVSDPSDYLLLTDGYSYSLLYNKKIYTQTDIDADDNQMWFDKHIIGYASIASMGGDTSGSPWLHRTYGSDKVKRLLIASLLEMKAPRPIRMDEDDAQLVNSFLKDNKLISGIDKEVLGRPTVYHVANGNPIWKQMAFIEKKYRKPRDQHNEFLYRIHERAESLSE